MATPTFQDLMRPVLALHADDRDHAIAELRSSMASEFQLTADELEEILPSGRQTKFNNRVGWATTYLFQTGLLVRPGRGITRITERGHELLSQELERIDLKVLGQFPELEEFRKPKETEADTSDASGSGSGSETPEEEMETAYEAIRFTLVEELLARVMHQSPVFFERLVLDVLRKMGYGGRTGSVKRTGQPGDAGLDGVIHEDQLGLDAIYVQAKRWEGTVQRPVVQGFVGALHGVGSRKGVMITTSTFSPGAREYAEKVDARVVLIDGRELAGMMIDHGVGVTEYTRFELKRIDEDFFPTDEEKIVATALGSDDGSESAISTARKSDPP